ncbi:MAG: S24 family peptidase [Bacteroidota bacterium]
MTKVNQIICESQNICDFILSTTVNFLKQLAKNLKFIREGKNLLQSDVPGFSASQWGNYERSLSKPGLDDLERITKYFGFTETELLHHDLSKEGKFDEKGRYIKIDEKGKSDGKGLGKNTAKKYPHSANLSFVNEDKPVVITKDRVPQVITIDSQGNENVVMVPVKARAGYLNGYADPEFMAILPAYRLPGLNNGTFRLFEVDGLSMYPTLHAGDLVIGSYVEQLGIVRDDRVHVIVTNNDGVVVKRVLNRIKTDGKLILKSDNYKDRDMYPPIVCDQQDVIEIWYATGFISRQMRPPSETYNRLIDLEGRFTLLEAAVKKGG